MKRSIGRRANFKVSSLIGTQTKRISAGGLAVGFTKLYGRRWNEEQKRGSFMHELKWMSGDWNHLCSGGSSGVSGRRRAAEARAPYQCNWMMLV